MRREVSSCNPIYDALEDAFLAALELGDIPPSEMVLSADEMQWLLALKITNGRGEVLPVSTTRVRVRFGDHTVVLRSEFDPSPWDVDVVH